MKLIRVPLGCAIFLLVLFFFLAITYESEKLWIAFGINLVLVIIGLVRASIKRKELMEAQASFVSSNIVKREIERKIDELDPETLFQIGILHAKEANNENELKEALALIIYSAQREYEPAREFLSKANIELNKN